MNFLQRFSSKTIVVDPPIYALPILRHHPDSSTENHSQVGMTGLVQQTFKEKFSFEELRQKQEKNKKQVAGSRNCAGHRKLFCETTVTSSERICKYGRVRGGVHPQKSEIRYHV